MTGKTIPTFGFPQPTFGVSAALAFTVVKGQTKRPKYVAVRTRRTIAENIVARMKVRYAEAGDRTKALAEDAGTSLSTIQRATNPDRYATGITVDVLTQIAMALRCEPEDLLRRDRAAA
jgi:DNA-binding Xre family transcriptional regulator